jgi:hypothetical protein
MLKEIFPVNKTIQGLLPRKDPEGAYWSLLAKIELGKFRENKKEMKKA